MATNTTTTRTTTTARRPTLCLALGTLGVLIATLFFWLSAFSVPFIKGIHYIHTRENDVKFGNFGWCAGPKYTFDRSVQCLQQVGYDFRPWVPGGEGPTGALIFVALTAGFGSLAFLALLASLARAGLGIFGFALTAFTTFLSVISWFLVLIIWGTAHRRSNHDNLDAHYGAAFVLVIIGTFIFIASCALVALGWLRGRRYQTHTTTVTARG
ncbi:hypothetical protein I317_06672 [Kwoniella heveanensis CBS 569]|nr:hypothetical protein I317_06672 [Kwoniella heveanensis CBS 569]